MKKLSTTVTKHSNVNELVIPLECLKPKIKKELADLGTNLYFLESVFGECDGHGFGFGGEDIQFTLKDGKKKYFVNIFNNGKQLQIGEVIDIYDQNGVEIDREAKDISLDAAKIVVKKLCLPKTKIPELSP